MRAFVSKTYDFFHIWPRLVLLLGTDLILSRTKMFPRRPNPDMETCQGRRTRDP